MKRRRRKRTPPDYREEKVLLMMGLLIKMAMALPHQRISTLYFRKALRLRQLASHPVTRVFAIASGMKPRKFRATLQQRADFLDEVGKEL